MIRYPHATPAKCGEVSRSKMDLQSPQASASTNSAIRAFSCQPDEECQQSTMESSMTTDVDSDTREIDSVTFSPARSGCTKRKQLVYFIQCNGTGGPIKIGIAVDPNRRLSELRIGCPFPMTLLSVVEAEDAAAEESRLHSVFSYLRIHGEWFTCATELLEVVRTMPSQARQVGQHLMFLIGQPQHVIRRRLVPRKAAAK